MCQLQQPRGVQLAAVKDRVAVESSARGASTKGTGKGNGTKGGSGNDDKRSSGGRGSGRKQASAANGSASGAGQGNQRGSAPRTKAAAAAAAATAAAATAANKEAVRNTRDAAGDSWNVRCPASVLLKGPHYSLVDNRFANDRPLQAQHEQSEHGEQHEADIRLGEGVAAGMFRADTGGGHSRCPCNTIVRWHCHADAHRTCPKHA